MRIKMARKRAHRRAVLPMGDMFAVGGCDCTCGGGPSPLCPTCFAGGAPAHLTDPAGSCALTFNSGTGAYEGSYTLSNSGVNSVTVVILGVIETYTTGTISILVSYSVRCNDAVSPNPCTLAVARSWRPILTDGSTPGDLSCSGGGTLRYIDQSLVAAGYCGQTTKSATNVQPVLTCSPLSWSYSFSGIGGTLDPAPGTATITS